MTEFLEIAVLVVVVLCCIGAVGYPLVLMLITRHEHDPL